MASRLQDVIIRDTRANQPAATDVSAGTLYYVTDEGVTERSNGTSWESFSDTGVVASVIISGGASSASLNSIVFSNSNGVSFGLSGSTITASHNGISSQSNQALSAANGSFAFQTAFFSNGSNVSFSTSVGSAIFGIVATSLTNIHFSAGLSSEALSSLVFSNSNNVSFGLSGSTVTASAASSLTNINVSAGAASANLSALVFSNSNGVSFGLNGSTVTASAAGGGAAQTFSEYVNLYYVVDMRTAMPYDNRIAVMPMPMPFALSGEYLRYPMSVQSLNNRTFGATSANTSWSARRADTIGNQLFSRGTGASSISLFSVSNFTQGLTYRTVFSNDPVTGSHWSATLDITYGLGTTLSSTSTTYACTSQSYVVNTANFGSLINSVRWMEVPFNSSVAPGNYYLGFARSTQSTNNGGATGLSTTNVEYALGMVSLTSMSIPRQGSNTGSLGFFLGMGALTTNVPVLTTDSFGTAVLLGTGAVNANIIPFMVL